MISDTYTNRIFRPRLFAVGIFVGIIALFLLSFEDVWEPVVYQFLGRHKSLSFITGFVPYFGLLASFFSAFLVLKSKRRLIVGTKENIDRDRP